MPKLAIIGTGIAGLGCAHFLHHEFDLTLFESSARPGGHASPTMFDHVITRESKQPFDQGFIIFNPSAHPLLTRLFRELDVTTRPAIMSYSVRDVDTGLEFSGSSLNHLFAQRRNLIRPGFWRLLNEIQRFNREAEAALNDTVPLNETVEEYFRRNMYGDELFNLYVEPLSSAVWRRPRTSVRALPATALLRFFQHHGLLGRNAPHTWHIVPGGAKMYVEKLTAAWRERIRLGDAVTTVVRTTRGALVTTAAGISQLFDHVILACHADEALRLLPNPTATEARLLREFHYRSATATVHTDIGVMPTARLAWSSCNYEINRDTPDAASCATHYWLNSLQGLPDHENYFVTIDRAESIDPKKIIGQLQHEQPVLNLGAMQAQAQIPALNAGARGSTETYFVGAWQRYGFREDGLLSAIRVCETLLGRDPWPSATT